MKLATVLREAGVCTRVFPGCSEIDIVLYDGKDRIVEDDVHYVESLFAKNIEVFDEFFDFIDELDSEAILTMNVKIDEEYVILFYKTSRAKCFRRKPVENPVGVPPMDPIDYMD